MSPEEKSFLRFMDYVEFYVDAWEVHDGMCIHPGGVTDHFRGCEILRRVKRNLHNAGVEIGLNPRFKVILQHKPNKITIEPQNGQAERLLKRYDALYMERELSRD